jgi:hypothetical protein
VPEAERVVFAPNPKLSRTNAGQGTLSRFIVPESAKKRRIGIIALATTVFAMIVVTLIFQVTGSTKKKVVSGGVKTVHNQAGAIRHSASPVEQLRTALPSFIPKQTLDVQFGKANPGWERYNDTGTEYKVYREKTVIRALQVIDRSGRGISTLFFNSVLKEIAGSPNYVVEATERKGDFSIEKGQLAINAKIIIYRKQPGAQVRAFLVDFR